MAEGNGESKSETTDGTPRTSELTDASRASERGARDGDQLEEVVLSSEMTHEGFMSAARQAVSSPVSVGPSFGSNLAAGIGVLKDLLELTAYAHLALQQSVGNAIGFFVTAGSAVSVYSALTKNSFNTLERGRNVDADGKTMAINAAMFLVFVACSASAKTLSAVSDRETGAFISDDFDYTVLSALLELSVLMQQYTLTQSVMGRAANAVWVFSQFITPFAGFAYLGAVLSDVCNASAKTLDISPCQSAVEAKVFSGENPALMGMIFLGSAVPASVMTALINWASSGMRVESDGAEQTAQGGVLSTVNRALLRFAGLSKDEISGEQAFLNRNKRFATWVLRCYEATSMLILCYPLFRLLGQDSQNAAQWVYPAVLVLGTLVQFPVTSRKLDIIASNRFERALQEAIESGSQTTLSQVLKQLGYIEGSEVETKALLDRFDEKWKEHAGASNLGEVVRRTDNQSAEEIFSGSVVSVYRTARSCGQSREDANDLYHSLMDNEQGVDAV